MEDYLEQLLGEGVVTIEVVPETYYDGSVPLWKPFMVDKKCRLWYVVRVEGHITVSVREPSLIEAVKAACQYYKDLHQGVTDD